MTTFVAVHGAWSAGWAWHKMHALFAAGGHRLITPTCTGLGERSHLVSPQVDLNLHIEDIIRVFESENLQDVVLIGHSYGGMVVTGVADRVSAHIRKLVYVDALLPFNGECALDVLPESHKAGIMRDVHENGHGWLISASQMPPDTPEEDRQLAIGRRIAQPFRTFSTPVHLTGRGAAIPTTYIYCTHVNAFDSFGLSASRARGKEAWQYIEMAASHNPHITVPHELARLLFSIALN